jgi:hypothetical protein
MGERMQQGDSSGRLRCGIVLRVREDACEIVTDDERSQVRYAPGFPSPRSERVSPGHLVALASVPGSSEAVVWRWYDAVVLEEEAGSVRLWEPAHGEIWASPRGGQGYRPGARAYLSAGLPGADWWLAGSVVARADDAQVELDEVGRFITEHDVWNRLG